jgi:hypothetical protein
MLPYRQPEHLVRYRLSSCRRMQPYRQPEHLVRKCIRFPFLQE